LILLAALAAPAIGDDLGASVCVYMPRDAMIDDDQITLGAIAVVRGDDEEMAAKARDVTMGRAPWSQETLVVDRKTVLARLASAGIKGSDVKIAGARETTVRREETLVAADTLIAQAEAFLKSDAGLDESVRWKLSARPKDLIVPGSKSVTFKTAFTDEDREGHLTVEVTAMADEQVLGKTTVVFRTVYAVRRLVAAKAIGAGEAISPQNTRVEKVDSDRPEEADWTPPYGKLAARALPEGAMIDSKVVRDKQPPIVVERNQSVVLKLSNGWFTITAAGIALEEGRTGQIIKVRNADSKRVIVAQIMPDGTLQPNMTN
jgi:flagella basal body P-ring formation protein FlgA